MAAKKGGLGRGLDALFNENATDEKGVVTLRLSEIEPYRVMNAPDVSEVLYSRIRRKHRILQKDEEIYVLVVMGITQRVSGLPSGFRIAVGADVKPDGFSPVDRIFAL